MTEQQMHAINKVQEVYGRQWKSKLLANWMKSSYPSTLSDISADLQQIRNEFGPRWLNKFKAN